MKSPKLWLGLLTILMVCLGLWLVEWTAKGMMTLTHETGRRILMGAEDQYMTRLQNTIGQPYLLYTSAPNYEHPRHGPQHNADGYRGKMTPLEKRDGVLRVVCLGGSTTYGWSVARPEQAYPAQLEELLRSNLPSGYMDVEVINAGLPWGTSAEILTHYHFKYHYYQPDVVVINSGGNDANGYTYPYYHPDNSNWRQPMRNLRPLPEGWRWLARSRFASYIILNVFYEDLIAGGQFFINGGSIPHAPWFRINGELVAEPREIPLEKLSFAHNIETLILELRQNNVKVLLAPFRAAPGAYEQQGKDFELAQILRHEEILKDFSRQYSSVGFAPFPAEAISPGNWTDHCHLNASGEREKAEAILPYVLELFSPKKAAILSSRPG